MKLFLPLLAAVSSVAAHGYVNYTFSAGKSYTGFLPDYDNWQTPDPLRITRHVPDDGPVFDYTSGDLTCNVDAQLAKWRTTSHAPVNAGDEFTFAWVRRPDDHLGPITVWMAACGTDCTNFDATGNVWFKIDQMGLVSGTTDTGVWATSLLIKNNLSWTVTIPKTLKPGAYLLRMEIVALHSAHAPQFYPSCQHIVVAGSGSSTPASSELVAIPGYYKNDSSTNIDIWQNGQASYTIAGPAVTKLQSYTGSDPVNSNGGAKAQTLVMGKVVTSSTASSASAASSSDDTGSSSDDTGATSSDDGASSDDGSSDDGSDDTDAPAVTASAAPAATSAPTKSCRASRRRRDLKQGATKSKKRHSAKRRILSY